MIVGMDHLLAPRTVELDPVLDGQRYGSVWIRINPCWAEPTKQRRGEDEEREEEREGIEGEGEEECLQWPSEAIQALAKLGKGGGREGERGGDAY